MHILDARRIPGDRKSFFSDDTVKIIFHDIVERWDIDSVSFSKRFLTCGKNSLLPFFSCYDIFSLLLVDTKDTQVPEILFFQMLVLGCKHAFIFLWPLMYPVQFGSLENAGEGSALPMLKSIRLALGILASGKSTLDGFSCVDTQVL